jgi:hypothetical protein
MTEWHGREQNNGIFKTMKTQCQWNFPTTLDCDLMTQFLC